MAKVSFQTTQLEYFLFFLTKGFFFNVMHLMVGANMKLWYSDIQIDLGEYASRLEK